MAEIKFPRVLVIGAGMAGSEAAFFLAEKGVPVVLVENKTLQMNPAQKIPSFAELVCTNSLKSKDPNSAHGLLKTEMNHFGSLILKAANIHAVPAGDALAVDREKFSEEVTQTLKNHPLIRVVEAEAENPLIITTSGPSHWIFGSVSERTSFCFPVDLI